MGEAPLEILMDRMLRESGAEANAGAFQIAYREAVRKLVTAEGKLVDQSGGKGQYGHVAIELHPGESGSGLEFVSNISGGSMPKEYIAAVEQGMKEACEAGVLAGHPVTDIKVTLVDGSHDGVESSHTAFMIAGSEAMRTALTQASLAILEPVMEVQVKVHEDYMGDVLNDLKSRRGEITNIMSYYGVTNLTVRVPLSNMLGYATYLRSEIPAKAVYSMEFSSYDEVPRAVAEAIIAKQSA